MMEYYNEVSGRRAEYLRTKRLMEERDYDKINNLPVKLSKNDEGNVISYESNYLYGR